MLWLDCLAFLVGCLSNCAFQATSVAWVTSRDLMKKTMTSDVEFDWMISMHDTHVPVASDDDFDDEYDFIFEEKTNHGIHAAGGETAVFCNQPAKRSLPPSDDEISSQGDPKRARRSPSPSSFNTPDTPPSDKTHNLPGFFYDFLALREHPESGYVDKTQCILRFPDTFRCILLRPPRFGKTAFLSTLNQYHDLAEAGRFDQAFQSLVVHDPSLSVPWRRNQHLTLSFCFSKIKVYSMLSDLNEISSEIKSFVVSTVCYFLTKYAEELQISSRDAKELVECDISDMFANLFNLVRASGYTMFVSVDDYDAPALCSLAYIEHLITLESLAYLQGIMRVVDTYLLEPLSEGLDVIPKLFVTGTLSPQSLGFEGLKKLNLVADPNMQLSCGFTTEEAVKFATFFLDQPLNITEMQRTCGLSIFSPSDPLTEPVLHPQEIIHYIQKVARKPIYSESFSLWSSLLEQLPRDSHACDVVTTSGLIDLIAAGSMALPAHETDTIVSWSTLYDLGVLTYDCEGRLRIANDTILTSILQHIDSFFCIHYNNTHGLAFHYTYLYPMEAEEDPPVFLTVLSEVLQGQMHRAFHTYPPVVEPNMHGIFELVMRRADSCSRKDIDSSVLSPPQDIPIVSIRHVCGKLMRISLKTLSLRGLWHAGNLTVDGDDEPSVHALRALHEELVQESEESLKQRPYYSFDEGTTTLVGSFLDTAEPGVPILLAIGGARVLIGGRTEDYTIAETEEDYDLFNLD
ncbi:AAA-ATPase-like domain-containing protein [Favolaschia claudopus]|uniref:AAA-ATPase-like domain-containing protein n=1 Tax=Favolaschia claudopus TaxID=2862362 RepID=A0AAW0CM63_9AGAR